MTLNPRDADDELFSVEEAFKMIADYDFEPQEPIEMVLLDESVLPPGIPRLLAEETIRSKGEIWRIHANYADPFPSSLHAHNLESGLKLHLGTGIRYKRTKAVGQITCKNLRIIREALKRIQPPVDQCDDRA